MDMFGKITSSPKKLKHVLKPAKTMLKRRAQTGPPTHPLFSCPDLALVCLGLVVCTDPTARTGPGRRAVVSLLSTEVHKRAMNGRPEKRGAAVRRYTYYVYCECSFLSVSKLLLLVSFDLSLPVSSNPRKGPEPAPLVRGLSPIFVTS